MTEKNVVLQEPVTQHMRHEFCQLNERQTVQEALESIRQSPPAERIVYFYVTSVEGKLVGVIPTRRLLLNAPTAVIGDIMIRGVITIPHTATVLEACEYFVQHRLLAFPITDEGRMIGVVDVELYTDELEDLDRIRHDDDLFQLIGVHLSSKEVQTSSVAAYRSRFPWLLCNIGGGLAAAFLANFYDAELQKVVALSLFIPIVLALSESVAMQSVSLALAGLHHEKNQQAGLIGKLRRELVTGILLGVTCGVIVGLVSWLWKGDMGVVACLLIGIGGGVIGSALVGVAIPNGLRMAKLDPGIASGPIALACADMLTLLIYLNLARQIFQGA